MSNEQAQFLNYFVREGLLTNTPDASPEVANLVAEYRKLEAEVPSPQRAPGVLEAEAADRPLFVRGNHKQPAQAVPRRFLGRSMPSRLMRKTPAAWNWPRRCCARITPSPRA